jgi:acyl carrier protein phosphodiesterase
VNFLAHCLIGAEAGSGSSAPELIAGGFLGDFIKGTLPDSMPDGLRLGVQLHRQVDAYSNRHPDIRQSCRRFPPELRRLAPILVDIIGDHLLAGRWHEFHSKGLARFTTEAYASIAAHQDWLPEHGRRFLSYAADRDLLAGYADWPVAARSLTSITRRLGKSELDGQLLTCAQELLDPLESDFERYFPDVIRHAADWIEQQSRC